MQNQQWRVLLAGQTKWRFFASQGHSGNQITEDAFAGVKRAEESEHLAESKTSQELQHLKSGEDQTAVWPAGQPQRIPKMSQWSKFPSQSFCGFSRSACLSTEVRWNEAWRSPEQVKMMPAADSKSSLLPIRLGQATFQPRSPSTMGFWMILGFSANFPLSNPMKSIEIPCIFRSFHQISRSIPSEAVQLLGSSLWKWRPAESPDFDRLRSSQIAEDIMVKIITAAVVIVTF